MNDLDILQDQLSTTDESQDISQLALSDGYGYGYGYGYNEEDTIYVYEGYLVGFHDQFGEFGEFSELPGNIESYTELEDGTQITYSNPVFFYGGVTYIFVSTARGIVWDLNSSDLKWGDCDDVLFMGCRNKENGSSIEIPTSGTPVYYVDGYGLATDASSPFTWSILEVDTQIGGGINISYTYTLQVNQSYPKNSYFRPLYIKDESTSIESIMDDESTYFTTSEIFGNRFYGHIAVKESYSNSSEITSLVNQVVEESLDSNSSWDYSFKTHLVSPSTPCILSYFNSEDKQFPTLCARYQKYLTPIHSNSNYYSNNQWNKTNLRKLIPVLPQYDSYEAWNHYPIIKANYLNSKNYNISTYKYDLYYIKVLITKGGSLVSSSELQNYQITNGGNKYKFVEDSISDYWLYDNGTTNVSPNITLHSDISGDNSSNYTSSGMYFGLLTPETSDTTKTISIGLCDSQDNQVVAEKSYSILKTKDQFNIAYIVLDIPENKSVFVGDIPVHDCFVGDIPVQKIYVGDTQVWARS